MAKKYIYIVAKSDTCCSERSSIVYGGFFDIDLKSGALKMKLHLKARMITLVLQGSI